MGTELNRVLGGRNFTVGSQPIDAIGPRFALFYSQAKEILDCRGARAARRGA